VDNTTDDYITKCAWCQGYAKRTPRQLERGVVEVFVSRRQINFIKDKKQKSYDSLIPG